MGSVYERVAFNMQELTYRVHFTISSIGSPFPIDEEFVIRIEDDNGVYDFNGRIALCERFEYATEAVHDAEGALKADFTLMKLEEGRNAFVSLIDKTTGRFFIPLIWLMTSSCSGEMRANRRIAWNVTMIFP